MNEMSAYVLNKCITWIFLVLFEFHVEIWLQIKLISGIWLWSLEETISSLRETKESSRDPISSVEVNKFSLSLHSSFIYCEGDLLQSETSHSLSSFYTFVLLLFYHVMIQHQILTKCDYLILDSKPSEVWAK
jgi:hypothetical protein